MFCENWKSGKSHGNVRVFCWPIIVATLYIKLNIKISLWWRLFTIRGIKIVLEISAKWMELWFMIHLYNVSSWWNAKICIQFFPLWYNVLNITLWREIIMLESDEDRIQKIKNFKGKLGTLAATTSSVINNFNFNVNRLIHVQSWLHRISHNILFTIWCFNSHIFTKSVLGEKRWRWPPDIFPQIKAIGGGPGRIFEKKSS